MEIIISFTMFNNFCNFLKLFFNNYFITHLNAAEEQRDETLPNLTPTRPTAEETFRKTLNLKPFFWGLLTPLILPLILILFLSSWNNTTRYNTTRYNLGIPKLSKLLGYLGT